MVETFRLPVAFDPAFVPIFARLMPLRLPASYIIFQEDGLIKALNCEKGFVEFSGTDAIAILQDVVDSYAPDESGITIHLAKGRFTGSGTLSIPEGFALTLRGEGWTTRWNPVPLTLGTVLETTGSGPLIQLTGTAMRTTLNMSNMILNIENDNYETCLSLDRMFGGEFDKLMITRKGANIDAPTVPNSGSKAIYLPYGLGSAHYYFRNIRIIGYEVGFDSLADWIFLENCVVAHSNLSAYRINASTSAGNAPFLMRCVAFQYGDVGFRITGSGSTLAIVTLLDCAVEGPSPDGFTPANNSIYNTNGAPLLILGLPWLAGVGPMGGDMSKACICLYTEAIAKIGLTTIPTGNFLLRTPAYPIVIRRDSGDYGGGFANYTPPTGDEGAMVIAEDENAVTPGRRLYVYSGGAWRYVDLT